VNDKAIALDDATGWLHMPLQERIADKLGDILLASDEILDLIRCGRAEHVTGDALFAVERLVSSVYHQVNDVMKSVCD
jgi:hypothetical protein